MFLSEDRESLQKLIDSKIQFYVSMGYAVNYHIGHRSLNDVDIVIKLSDLETVSKILKAPIVEDIKRGDRIRIIYTGNIEISCFCYFSENGVNFQPSNEALLSRCEPIEGDPEILVLSLEDLIIKKLFYGRNKDLIDVVNMMFFSTSRMKLKPFRLLKIFFSLKAKSTIFLNTLRLVKLMLLGQSNVLNKKGV